jgi:hypothetical protein
LRVAESVDCVERGEQERVALEDGEELAVETAVVVTVVVVARKLQKAHWQHVGAVGCRYFDLELGWDKPQIGKRVAAAVVDEGVVDASADAGADVLVAVELAKHSGSIVAVVAAAAAWAEKHMGHWILRVMQTSFDRIVSAVTG